MDDFKNKELIDRPRGKVYSRAANADLLARAACAPHLTGVRQCKEVGRRHGLGRQGAHRPGIRETPGSAGGKDSA